jgi:hypothetical protein
MSRIVSLLAGLGSEIEDCRVDQCEMWMGGRGWTRNAYGICMRRAAWKRPLGRLWRESWDSIKMNLTVVWYVVRLGESHQWLALISVALLIFGVYCQGIDWLQYLSLKKTVWQFFVLMNLEFFWNPYLETDSNPLAFFTDLRWMNN